MKKTAFITAIFMLCLVGLSACGGETAKEVNLEEFWAGVEAEYDMPMFVEESLEDMIEVYYPGLSEISLKQSLVKIPGIAQVVYEYAFVETENEADAAAVAEIFQKRIDDQAAGGAWYPSSVEAWKRAVVVQNGSFVGMIAGDEKTEAIVEAWNAQF